MTVSFEEIKARLLANPEVKREYDGLTPEFEACATPLCARKSAATKAPHSRSVFELDRDFAPQR
jgi:hypothetical protein